MSYEKLNKLNTINKVNALISVTIESYVTKEITVERARTIERLCNTLIRGLQVGQLEKRVEVLEKSLNEKGGIR